MRQRGVMPAIGDFPVDEVGVLLHLGCEIAGFLDGDRLVKFSMDEDNGHREADGVRAGRVRGFVRRFVGGFDGLGDGLANGGRAGRTVRRETPGLIAGDIGRGSMTIDIAGTGRKSLTVHSCALYALAIRIVFAMLWRDPTEHSE